MARIDSQVLPEEGQGSLVEAFYSWFSSEASKADVKIEEESQRLLSRAAPSGSASASAAGRNYAGQSLAPAENTVVNQGYLSRGLAYFRGQRAPVVPAEPPAAPRLVANVERGAVANIERQAAIDASEVAAARGIGVEAGAVAAAEVGEIGFFATVNPIITAATGVYFVQDIIRHPSGYISAIADMGNTVFGGDKTPQRSADPLARPVLQADGTYRIVDVYAGVPRSIVNSHAHTDFNQVPNLLPSIVSNSKKP